MTQLLERKQTLAAYARDRLGVGAVRVAGGVALPDPGSAAGASEVLAIRDRLVGASAKAAEAEVEAHQKLQDVTSRTELLKAELSLEEIEEERAARQQEREQERRERREQQSLSTVGLVQSLIERQDGGGGEVAALRAELDRLREERTSGQLLALQQQNEELRAEIRAAATRGASGPDGLVEQFEHIIALRSRMDAIFGRGNAPSETAADITILEAQHRHGVEMIELEHRIRIEDERLHLEGRRNEDERADRTRRGDQLDAVLEQVAPALEQALDQFAASRLPAAAQPVAIALPPTPLYPLPLPPAPPPDVDSGPCPSCGATVLMHRSQDTAVCPGCMFLVQRQAAGGEPDAPDSVEPPRAVQNPV